MQVVIQRPAKFFLLILLTTHLSRSLRNKQINVSFRAPWFCGLMRPNALDREVEGLNLAAARSNRFLMKRRWNVEEGNGKQKL